MSNVKFINGHHNLKILKFCKKNGPDEFQLLVILWFVETRGAQIALPGPGPSRSVLFYTVFRGTGSNFPVKVGNL